MKRALAILVAACGGGARSGPPPEPPAPVVSAKPTTRVPVEDSEIPDTGVTVLNSKGHMEQAAVEQGIKPHEAELTDCYMTKVGRRHWLLHSPAPPGRIRLVLHPAPRTADKLRSHPVNHLPCPCSEPSSSRTAR